MATHTPRPRPGPLALRATRARGEPPRLAAAHPEGVPSPCHRTPSPRPLPHLPHLPHLPKATETDHSLLSAKTSRITAPSPPLLSGSASETRPFSPSLAGVSQSLSGDYSLHQIIVLVPGSGSGFASRTPEDRRSQEPLRPQKVIIPPFQSPQKLIITNKKLVISP